MAIPSAAAPATNVRKFRIPGVEGEHISARAHRGHDVHLQTSLDEGVAGVLAALIGVKNH